MLLLTLALLQQVPSVRLDKPTASPREPFTQISGLVELPDGRLLVADADERRLVILDPMTSAVTPLSQRGAGPREFRSISHLFPRPGGGAWLGDFAQKRILPIRGDGTLEDVIAVPPSLLLAAVDGAGRFYADIFGPRIGNRMADSMWVVRWAPPATTFDTLMKRNANWSSRITMNGEARHVLSPFDAHLVLASGDVVTLDAAAYRFDRWHDGRRIVSVKVPWRPVPVTEAEKVAYVQAEEPPKQLNLNGPKGKPGGGTTGGRPANWKDGGKIWPANKPAFVDDDVHLASDGRIWIRRYTAHDVTEAQYDVLDDNGKLLGTVRFRPDTKVVGFGKGVVYVSERNADDELLLRRYALPRL